MAAISLFWNTNVAAAASSGNAPSVSERRESVACQANFWRFYWACTKRELACTLSYPVDLKAGKLKGRLGMLRRPKTSPHPPFPLPWKGHHASLSCLLYLMLGYFDSILENSPGDNLIARRGGKRAVVAVVVGLRGWQQVVKDCKFWGWYNNRCIDWESKSHKKIRSKTRGHKFLTEIEYRFKLLRFEIGQGSFSLDRV